MQQVDELMKFSNRIDSYIQNCFTYEKEDYKQEALKLIPEDIQKIKSEVDLDQLQIDQDWEVEKLKKLLRWFKFDFFSWVNSPECGACGNKETVYLQTGVGETEEEIKGKANRVEYYECKQCGETLIKFPRYNDPKALLNSRKGRCGEWANCFTQCCVAVDLQVRIAVDFTDHVWTEMWSHKQKRFIHADSCENEHDKPLLYEKGWGKKLNYVIAVGTCGVQDVTFRYTDNLQQTALNRNLLPESELENLINQKNLIIQNQIFENETKLIYFFEFQENLENERNNKFSLFHQNNLSQNYLPRQSGSKEWIQARGEDGKSNQK